MTQNKQTLFLVMKELKVILQKYEATPEIARAEVRVTRSGEFMQLFTSDNFVLKII
jgi:hypothetical protein